MQVVEISLTQEEKNKMLTFIKSKVEQGETKLNALSKELNILNMVKEKHPASAPPGWLKTIDLKISNYNNNIKASTENLKGILEISKDFTENKAVTMHEGTGHFFIDLYHKEKDVQKLDNKYKYYPRLKKAKENTLHVFANKLKIIVEAKSVRIA